MNTLNKGIDIISIGDELLIGQVINTNSSWMAEILNSNALEVNRIITIGDSHDAITKSLNNSLSNANLVLITGGLGPTKDDITKDCICNFFDSKLILHNETLKHVECFFAKRGLEITEINKKQAMVPDNCVVIPNKLGTAPGMYLKKDDVHFIFMPGVPFEMKEIITSWVIPYFTNHFQLKAKSQKTILTHGLGESFLSDKIENWENNLNKNTKLAYLPSPGMVKLRLSVVDDTKTKCDEELELQINKLKNIIPELIYGFDKETMESVVGKLLLEKNKTVSTAESCTGGYIAHKITSIAGSSKYFKGSIIAYENSIKTDILGIDKEIIETQGAVSQQVVELMASNVKKKLKTDFGIATTGIAGPDGGTETKPVGTVWIAIATENTVISHKFSFGNTRERNIILATTAALNMLRKKLLTKI